MKLKLTESQKFSTKITDLQSQGEAVSSISVNIKQSPQHVEVNLSELKGYEKHIIVELIMERYNKSNKECRGKTISKLS